MNSPHRYSAPNIRHSALRAAAMRVFGHCPLLVAVLFVLLAGSLVGCQRTEVYMEYHPVSTTGWTNNETLEFDLGPVPEDGTYVLSVDARTTKSSAYPYRVLNLEVRQLWSKEDDAVADSIYRDNDSTMLAHRAAMTTDEQLIAANNEKVGFDRRAQLQAEKERKDDLKRQGKSAQPKPKGEKKPASGKKGAAGKKAAEKPKPSPRDSIIAVTDSLIKAIDLMKADIWRREAVNDSIEADRAKRVAVDSVNFDLSIDDDESTGIVVQQHRSPVKTIELLKGQTAHIIIRHIMRLEAVTGISDIGISLEKQ